MGTIQKSSLRLTFGFILAFSISVLLNIGLSTPSSAATSYKRINNQTIIEGLNVYLADSLVAPPDISIDAQFWNVKGGLPASPGLCEKYLSAFHSSAGPLYWTMTTSAKINNGNLCADSKTSTLPTTLDNSGSNYFFYKDVNNIIKPALTGSSNFEFTQIANVPKLKPKDAVYIQTKPAGASLCPRLLVWNTTNHWGFIEPFVSNQSLVDNTESVWYRATLKTAGITGKDNCNADQGYDTQHQTEIGLSKLIGGTDAFWSKDQGWNPMDFYGLSVVKKLGDAVAPDKSAAQIRENTTTPGSIAPPITKNQPEAKSGATTCGIDGIGWIVCPVLSFMGTITDSAFGFLAGNFLETKADTIAHPATKSAWSVMRNLANVAFVIAFLIIIFSQMTSVGITNYGVKKMLPRLVVAAILVNLSFVICQIAVDISNILGYSLKNMFDSFQTFTRTPGVVNGAEAAGTANPWGVGVLVAGIIAGAVGLALAVTVPVLMAALLALMLVVLILFARTALIILLVVVSPLAFVAYLLPNTEQWFKKWYKMFASLLLVFPLIAVVVGASGLAAGILKAAAGDDKMLQVVAIGVATIPLFIVPSLLKNSLSAAGTIGTKLAGYSSKANSQIGSKVKTDSRLGEAMQSRKINGVRNRAMRRANPNHWQSRLDNSTIGKRLGFDRGARAATQIADKAFEEEVSAADVAQKNYTNDEAENAAIYGKVGGKTVTDTNGVKTYSGGRSLSNAEQTAAARNLMKVGNSDQRRALYVAASTNTESVDVRQAARNGFYATGDNKVYGAGFGDTIQAGKIKNDADMDDALIIRANKEGFSAETLVQDTYITKRIADIAATGGRVDEDGNPLGLRITQESLDNIRANAITADTEGSATKGKISSGMRPLIDTLKTL